MKFIHATIVLALSTFAICAAAHDYTAGTMRIGHPFARATAPGQPAAGGYLKLSNTGTAADRLVSVRAEVSNTVELHTMRMDGDVMRMRQVDAIEVPAGQSVELKPGGLHLMFIGLKAPLKAGDRFPLTLTFEKAGEVKVDVAVEAVAAAAAPAEHKH
jgi:copper(I)-binding protein